MLFGVGGKRLVVDNMEMNIRIIEKPDWVSWDEIHDVIWESHEGNRMHGIVMRFPSLYGDEIKKRIENNQGKMFIALVDQKVVGTAAIKMKTVNLWCGKGDYAYMCFASVLSEYRGKGIYRHLYSVREKECRKMGLKRLLFDTNEKNCNVLDINLKNGYKKVSYRQYDDHYNVICVKWLDGCPYSDFRCRIEYGLQKLRVKARTLLTIYKNG